MKKEKIISGTESSINDKKAYELLTWMDSISGTATKKIDYVKLTVDQKNNIEDLIIECGTGLNSNNTGHSPLKRVLRTSLLGDEIVDEVESSRDTNNTNKNINTNTKK